VWVPGASVEGFLSRHPATALDERPQDMPRLKAKGLSTASRSQRLSYSAPTVDGDDEVSVHTDAVEGGELEYAGTPRNAMCPCGSGKKYKRCHGDPQSEHYKH
jgi:preprotein translocase subunit SecA